MTCMKPVVICFQISIFDTIGNNICVVETLKQRVVICFQISIFDTIGNNPDHFDNIGIAL